MQTASSTLQWPDDCVSLFKNVAPGDAAACLFDEAPAVAECPNFWTPKETILAGPNAALTLAEAAVSLLYSSVMKHQLKDIEWSGAEWWTQVYEPGKGLAFHFDKDETVMEESGDVLCPIFSSVYYLSDDPNNSRLGPTVVLHQTFDQEAQKPKPDNPDQCALVFPSKNSYFDVVRACCQSHNLAINQPHDPAAMLLGVFHGGLAHGVLDAASQEAISRVTPEQVSNYGLSTVEDMQLQDLIHPTGESEGSSIATQDRPGASTAAIVTVSEAESESVITIDDLLRNHSISLHGEEQTDIIVIEHQGMSLMPLTEEQLESVQVGAALVPLAMLLSSDDEEPK